MPLREGMNHRGYETLLTRISFLTQSFGTKLLRSILFRTVGDQVNPPILPWVTDFTSEINLKNVSNSEEAVLSTPWRDLTKVGIKEVAISVIITVFFKFLSSF